MGRSLCLVRDCSLIVFIVRYTQYFELLHGLSRGSFLRFCISVLCMSDVGYIRFWTPHERLRYGEMK